MGSNFFCGKFGGEQGRRHGKPGKHWRFGANPEVGRVVQIGTETDRKGR